MPLRCYTIVDETTRSACLCFFSYVLDTLPGVDRLYPNDLDKVLALARAHLTMPAKEFRRMFSNFMAFAAWCRYYPDVRRDLSDEKEQYSCARTGWRYVLPDSVAIAIIAVTHGTSIRKSVVSLPIRRLVIVSKVKTDQSEASK